MYHRLGNYCRLINQPSIVNKDNVNYIKTRIQRIPYHTITALEIFSDQPSMVKKDNVYYIKAQ